MIEIPEWLAVLKKDARIDIKGLSALVGIKRWSMYDRIKAGTAPPPDYIKGQSVKYGKPAMGLFQWKAVTVRNYIRHLNRLELEESK